MEAKYTIPFPPTPWTPARRRGNFFYNPRDKEKKRDVACVLSQKVIEFVGPVRVDMIFYMPIPKSLSKKKKIELEKERTYHIKKCDLDNMRKHTDDILEIAGVFKNDSQVCIGLSVKLYSANPRTEIVVSSLTSLFSHNTLDCPPLPVSSQKAHPCNKLPTPCLLHPYRANAFQMC